MNNIDILIGFSYDNNKSILYKYVASVMCGLKNIKNNKVKIHAIVHNEEAKELLDKELKEIVKEPNEYKIYVKPSNVKLNITEKVLNRGKEGAFYRFLGQKVGINVPYLFYFDQDVLIDDSFENKINEIYKDIENYEIAAHVDSHSHLKYINHDYCCSGVIYFNCKNIKYDIGDTMMSKVKENNTGMTLITIFEGKEVPMRTFADQNLMNALGENIKTYTNNFDKFINGVKHDVSKKMNSYGGENYRQKKGYKPSRGAPINPNTDDWMDC